MDYFGRMSKYAIQCINGIEHRLQSTHTHTLTHMHTAFHDCSVRNELAYDLSKGHLGAIFNSKSCYVSLVTAVINRYTIDIDSYFEMIFHFCELKAIFTLLINYSLNSILKVAQKCAHTIFSTLFGASERNLDQGGGCDKWKEKRPKTRNSLISNSIRSFFPLEII